MSNYISYANLLKERDNFRKAGTKSGSDFNLFDTPGHKYFKLFFYFNNGDVNGNYNIEASSGLLAPTWLIPNVGDPTYYLYNSAWSYLKMNYEDERADLLVDFVNLLSNINSESPWYFSEISGLDSAMERKMINSENFSIDNTRSKITIKCLPDAYDDRISTLLDLYRTIVWSWTTKREMVPTNLRKFDMGILIYETPNNPFHKIDKLIFDEYAVVGGDPGNSYITSYKYIELHNCEIDYSSSKNIYSSLNNKDGFQAEYSIDINFDDCYETRYNEFMMKKFGDLIEIDLLNNYQISTYQYSEPKINKIDLQQRINFFDQGFLKEAADQLLQTGKGLIKSVFKKAILGNLYTFSLTRIGDQIASLANGDILSAARNAAEYINDAKQRKENQLNNLNIFNNNKVFVTADNPMGTLSVEKEKRIIPKVSYMGNLYKGNTIADNL